MEFVGGATGGLCLSCGVFCVFGETWRRDTCDDSCAKPKFSKVDSLKYSYVPANNDGLIWGGELVRG